MSTTDGEFHQAELIIVIIAGFRQWISERIGLANLESRCTELHARAVVRKCES